MGEGGEVYLCGREYYILLYDLPENITKMVQSLMGHPSTQPPNQIGLVYTLPLVKALDLV